MRIFRTFLATVVAVSGPLFADNLESSYSTIDTIEENCLPPNSELNPTRRFLCEGHNDYKILLGDADLRMSLWFGRFPEESEPTWQSFSSFNYSNTVVEWRLNSGQPFATITRWFVEPSQSVRMNVLVVSKVASDPGDASCWVGVIDARQNKNANELARLVADKVAPNFDCSIDLPKVYGRTGSTTPYFSPSGGAADAP